MNEERLKPQGLVINDYPSNSKTSKRKEAEEKDIPKAKKVVEGKVVTKKPPLSTRFKNIFFGENVDDVKTYVVQDVFIPALKATIDDIIDAVKEAILYGEITGRKRQSRNQSGTRVSYQSYYQPGGRPSNNQTRDTQRQQVNRYIFDSRSDAERVLSDMIDYIIDYGAVRVSDLNDMIGITGQFTDTYWGWTDLSSATVKRDRDGYYMDLPRAISLR